MDFTLYRVKWEYEGRTHTLNNWYSLESATRLCAMFNVRWEMANTAVARHFYVEPVTLAELPLGTVTWLHREGKVPVEAYLERLANPTLLERLLG